MRRMCFIPFDYTSNYRGQYDFSLPGYKIQLSYIWEKVLEVKLSKKKEKKKETMFISKAISSRLQEIKLFSL